MRDYIEKMDYVGFSFNNQHTSQYGIKNVTSGNRYQKDLLPAFQDYNTNTPGMAGSYYFGCDLKTRSFNFSLAFDDVSEQEVREMSNWLFNKGQIAPLILDELPYIQYYVKVASPPQMKYLTFDDLNGARVYKGEMNINFVAYDPYGYIVRKFLNQYPDENTGEWSVSSGLLISNIKSGVPYYDLYYNGKIPLYNPGDVETDFKLDLVVKANTIIVTLGTSTFALDTSKIPVGSMISIDTKKRIIKYNGTVANNLMFNGNLFKIPTGKVLDMMITGVSGAYIDYSYKYL